MRYNETFQRAARSLALAFLFVAVFCVLPAASCAGPASVLSAERSEPSLEIMAGSMIMAGFRGTALTPDEPLARALAGGQAGGVLLFSRDVVQGNPRNIRSPEQVSALIGQLRAAAPEGLLLAIDQEGGAVQRLNEGNGFRSWPSARAMGQGDPGATLALARDMGSVLAGLGFNLNFAPSVDLDFPDSPIIGDVGRAFHRDPERVAAHARAFAQGMGDSGIIAVLKHFPGHGSARGDTHDGYVDVSASWTPEELEPYRTLIAEGFDGAIMTAHVSLSAYGDLPATLNPAIVEGMLRRDLGWDGVVISDDMQMGALADQYGLEESVLLAVRAGVDMLIFGNNTRRYDPDIASKAHQALLRHVAEGSISPERIRQSWLRIRDLKARVGALWK